MSAASPTKAGAIVAAATYEVIIELIWKTETENVSESRFRAGK